MAPGPFIHVEGTDEVVELRSGLTKWRRDALYLPLIHRPAFAHALSEGVHPDRPENLSVVIRLDSPAR